MGRERGAPAGEGEGAVTDDSLIQIIVVIAIMVGLIGVILP